MRISHCTQNSFLHPSFQKVYTNSAAAEVIETYTLHAFPKVQMGLLNAINELEKATEKVKTHVVIERGAEDFTARIVETDHVWGMDSYKTTGYLTGEERLPDAIKTATEVLKRRYQKQEAAKRPRRKPFPGRNTLDING